MADDKSKRGPQDRAPVDGGEDYEVGYLMKKHHLERADALRLVKKVWKQSRKDRRGARYPKGLIVYLPQLAWAPDAILLNTALSWREDGSYGLPLDLALVVPLAGAD
jgi:hypothetical protein